MSDHGSARVSRCAACHVNDVTPGVCTAAATSWADALHRQEDLTAARVGLCRTCHQARVRSHGRAETAVAAFGGPPLGAAGQVLFAAAVRPGAPGPQVKQALETVRAALADLTPEQLEVADRFAADGWQPDAGALLAAAREVCAS